MVSFLAMLFTLHSGLGATPVSGAMTSLREQALTVAAEQAERDAAPAASPAAQEGGPRVRVLTREDWRGMLVDLLPSDRLANAAMWVMEQPVSVDVSGDKVFVSVRVGGHDR